MSNSQQSRRWADKRRCGGFWPAAATAALLAGIWMERAMLRSPPPDVGTYHARIRAAAQTLPVCVGPWLLTENPEPPGAVTLLKPNAIISRQVRRISAAPGDSAEPDLPRRFNLLLVHCRDVRDMLGHYPPICYPAQGWTQQSAQAVDRQVGDLTIHATSYVFSAEQLGVTKRIVVENFMILPDASTCRDLEQLEQVSRRRDRVFLGAAQVQLVFDDTYSAKDRAEFATVAVQACSNLIDAICSAPAARERAAAQSHSRTERD
ncbi:exosortase-associated EpsI family protein [Fontivita pretiosa]|uniref:exosortase-associated EpsI family protein n=1 Tax=Fontivita pretiosa TaxID=2989684 RepID=UPI003D17FE31